MESLIKHKITFNFHQKRGEILSYDTKDANEHLQNECFKELNNKNLNNEIYVSI